MRIGLKRRVDHQRAVTRRSERVEHGSATARARRRPSRSNAAHVARSGIAQITIASVSVDIATRNAPTHRRPSASTAGRPGTRERVEEARAPPTGSARARARTRALHAGARSALRSSGSTARARRSGRSRRAAARPPPPTTRRATGPARRRPTSSCSKLAARPSSRELPEVHDLRPRAGRADRRPHAEAAHVALGAPDRAPVRGHVVHVPRAVVPDDVDQLVDVDLLVRLPVRARRRTRRCRGSYGRTGSRTRRSGSDASTGSTRGLPRRERIAGREPEHELVRRRLGLSTRSTRSGVNTATDGHLGAGSAPADAVAPVAGAAPRARRTPPIRMVERGRRRHAAPRSSLAREAVHRGVQVVAAREHAVGLRPAAPPSAASTHASHSACESVEQPHRREERPARRIAEPRRARRPHRLARARRDPTRARERARARRSSPRTSGRARTSG